MNREERIDLYRRVVVGRTSLLFLLLERLTRKVEAMADTLDDVLGVETSTLTDVKALAQAVQQLKDGNATLQQELTDALAGVTLPPAVQEKISAALSAAGSVQQGVDNILASIAPTPAPPPTPDPNPPTPVTGS
jgi:hypothetical protein